MKFSPEPAQYKTLAIACELAGEVLRASGDLQIPASGHSMLPTVWPGDTLTIEPTSICSVRKGDIVLFARHGRLVAHRVVAKNSDQQGIRITTQGDAMIDSDAPIRERELLGKVRHISRAGKLVSNQPRGLSKLAFAPLVQKSSSAARLAVGIHGMFRKQHAKV